MGSATPPSRTFTATNSGGAPTGAMTVSLVGADPGDFVRGNDTCSAQTLGAGATCTVAVAFKPGARGVKSAALQVAAAPGATGSADLSGTGRDFVLLTVSKTGGGTGIITAAGIDCGLDCDENVPRTSATDPVVVLTSTGDPTWSIPSCGTSSTCAVTMSAPRTVTVNFGVRPDTTITAAPPLSSNSSNVAVEFTSSIVGSTFECAVDNAAPQPCTSPWQTDVGALGPHTLRGGGLRHRLHASAAVRVHRRDVERGRRRALQDALTPRGRHGGAVRARGGVRTASAEAGGSRTSHTTRSHDRSLIV